MTTFDEVLPPDITDKISQSVSNLLMRQLELMDRIAELKIEGCINGYIVEEYRNVKGANTGPYYRLHFYTNSYGLKPKPRYLGKDPEVVQNAQQQIDNYAIRQDYQAQLEEIDRVLSYTRRQVENLSSYLDFHTKDYRQLVMPTHDIRSAGVTKEEG